MNPIHQQPLPLRGLAPHRLSRRGLTFLELIFATMILGLGMIIIASVFPVAIAEQRATIDAAAASAVERNAARTLDALVCAPITTATRWLPTTTGNDAIAIHEGNLWDRFKGDLIDSADARYGWTAVFQRADTSPPAALPSDPPSRGIFYVFSLVSRSSATFGPVDKNPDVFQPKAIEFDYTITAGNDPDIVEIKQATPAADIDAVCEGAFIVRDGSIDPTIGIQIAPQSPIIKLGNQRPDLGSEYFYEVAPGFEIFGIVNLTGERGFMVGQTREKKSGDPDEGPFTGDYAGPSIVQTCRPIEVAIPYPG